MTDLEDAEVALLPRAYERSTDDELASLLKVAERRGLVDQRVVLQLDVGPDPAAGADIGAPADDASLAQPRPFPVSFVPPTS